MDDFDAVGEASAIARRAALPGFQALHEDVSRIEREALADLAALEALEIEEPWLRCAEPPGSLAHLSAALRAEAERIRQIAEDPLDVIIRRCDERAARFRVKRMEKMTREILRRLRLLVDEQNDEAA